MYFKLVYRNLKRNVLTYLVFFTTLIVLYSLIYAFNATIGNLMVGDLDQTRSILINVTSQIMGILSILIGIAVAFLVVYSTRFVLSRRSKEIGLYSSLGMKNKHIALVIGLEMMLVNIISLVIGLILGIILSVFLTKIAATIYGLNNQDIKIYLSMYSIKITMISGVLISIMVLFMSSIKLFNSNIMSLLKETEHSSSIKDEKKWIIILMFLTSIVCFTICTWYLISLKDTKLNVKRSYTIILLFLMGLLFFYRTLSSVIIKILMKTKGFYYKKFNSLRVRMYDGKSKEHASTISILSLFLTISFAIILMGVSAFITMKSEVSKAAPYNVTIFSSNETEGTIQEQLLKDGVNLATVLEKKMEMKVYESKYTYGDIMKESSELWELDKNLRPVPIPIISISDFNRNREMQGKDTVELGEDEFFINHNYKGTNEIIEDFISSNPTLRLGGKVFKLSNTNKTEDIWMVTSVGNNDRGSFVLPDDTVKILSGSVAVFNGVYKENTDESKITMQLNDWVMGHSWQDETGLNFDYKYQTRDRLEGMFYGFMGTLVFVSAFVGIIFTIISLCILSIHMSTEAISFKKDSVILKSLGMSDSDLFAFSKNQIAIYFLTPCIIAIPSSYLLSKTMVRYYNDFININVTIKPIVLLSLMLFFIIYIMITYGLYKNILTTKKRNN
ncbi:MAG TPA: FtsX-like permease family protein [Epulopiscium sp.]|nr:FtsX-like permease family protein [Candidatus Epulonipiscium sp.]